MTLPNTRFRLLLCAMLLGAATAASWLVVAASLAFVVVNVVVVRRQRAAHTVLLLVVGYTMSRQSNLTGWRLWASTLLAGLLGVAIIAVKALMK